MEGKDFAMLGKALLGESWRPLGRLRGDYSFYA